MFDRSSSARWWRLGGVVALALVAAVLAVVALRPTHQQPEAAPSATLSPVPSTPLTVFVGDSSVAGAGATKKTERWTTLASATLGWREQNLARPGSGYGAVDGKNGCDGAALCTTYARSLTAVQNAHPSVVVVASGPVTGRPDADSLSADVASYYRQLRTALPDATIIAVGPWSATKKPTAAEESLDAAVAAAAKSVRGVHVSLISPSAVDPSMTTKGGSQLNDVGHQAVADRLVSALDDDQSSTS